MRCRGVNWLPNANGLAADARMFDCPKIDSDRKRMSPLNLTLPNCETLLSTFFKRSSTEGVCGEFEMGSRRIAVVTVEGADRI